MQINADGPDWPTEKAIIEGNVIYENMAQGISLQGACGSRVANNVIFANRKGGIGVSKGSSDNLFVNNTLWAGAWAVPCVRVGSSGNYGPCRNNRLRSNILVSDQGKGVPLCYDGGGDELPDSDYNVLWAGANRPVVQNARGKRLTLKECQSQGFEMHSLTTDPQFRDPGKADFRLQLASPAAGTGAAEPRNSSPGAG